MLLCYYFKRSIFLEWSSDDDGVEEDGFIV